MKENTDTFDNIKETIIDNCTNILKQKNIIVYPSNEETHNDTVFRIKELLSSIDYSNGIKFKINELDSLPHEYSAGETIFVVYGPSHGYGLKIEETNVSISGYELLPKAQKKLRNLWSKSDCKSHNQKELRAKIANTKRMKELTTTACYLQNVMNKTK